MTTAKPRTTKDAALRLRALHARARRSLHGHYWTYAGYVLSKLETIEVDDAPITITFEDDVAGRIALDARFHDAGGERCVVVLHGLGGSLESRYVQLAVRAAQRAGLSTLRISFRGANGKGADVYHAGLTDDVRAALRCPELARMKHIYLLGYSMGGHITLRYASESSTRGIDARVRSVSAVCAPLDLRKCVDAIQRKDRLPYQYNVLKTLKEHYRVVEEVASQNGRKLAHSWKEVDAVSTIDEWDRLVICPRFGFANIDAYYAQCSAGPHVHALEIPTLMAIANADPMVPLVTLDPWLRKVSKSVEVRHYERGGHVAFPKDVSERASLEDDIVAWLIDHAI